MRGFLGGLVVGLGAVSLGAATVSLLAPLPPRPEVDSNAPKATQSDPGDLRPVDPEGADPDLVKSSPSSLGEDGNSDSPARTAPDDVDTQSAQRPEITLESGSLAGPSDAGQTPDLSEGPADVAAATEKPDLAAPSVPISDGDAQISTDPAQPPIPVLVQPEVSPGARPSLAGEAQTGADADGADAVSDADPSSDTSSDLAVAAQDTAPAPKPAALPQIGAEPDTTDTPQATTPDVAPDATQDAPETAELSPSIGTPAGSLIDTETAQDAIPTQAPIPAIELNAAEFDATGDRPLMAIVLMDLRDSVSSDALVDFPYPVSFALDPADPNAAEKMARHRANGHEVVLLADLPPAANPQDTEAAMQVWQSSLPQTVAFLEGTKSGFQTNRPASEQMMDIALASGHGLITQSNGLNTVQKLASKAGIPASVVFRDFDGTGQTPTVMRRFLDQAAFRAGQEGGVIMLGRLQPDTISALILWGLQDRAQRVALAPVSAVLISQNAQE